MEASDTVTFITTYFHVEPGEDEETNPGIYGSALAHWLSDQLCTRGVSVDSIVAEDWGRCIIVKVKPLRLNVACANLDGSTTEWRVYAFAERGPLQWLGRSGDAKAEVAELREHLAAIVPLIPGVEGIRWEAG